MRDEEIRIAVAEACGWTLENTGECWAWHKHGILAEEAPPDYHNDLNAMHEAEKLLKNTKPWSSSGEGDQPRQYIWELAKVTGVKMIEELVVSCEKKDRHLLNKRAKPYPAPIVMPRSAVILAHSIPAHGYEANIVFATARQRAEAFLRTLGKWVEDSPAS